MAKDGSGSVGVRRGDRRRDGITEEGNGWSGGGQGEGRACRRKPTSDCIK